VSAGYCGLLSAGHGVSVLAGDMQMKSMAILQANKCTCEGRPCQNWQFIITITNWPHQIEAPVVQHPPGANSGSNGKLKLKLMSNSK
jgi:hypothetical protein